MYLSDHDYDFIYSKVPRICVDLLVRNSEKTKVLLTKRTIEPYVNHWHFPGGRIKFRETIIDSLKRIANAELGISLEEVSLNPLGACEFLEEYQGGSPRHSISIVHELIIPEDTVFSAQDKYEWFLEIPELTIPPQKSFLTKFNILWKM